MHRYRVNLNIRDRAEEQRAQNEYLQDEYNRNRTQTLDMRAAVDRSTYRGMAYDPIQIAKDILAQMDIVETMTDEEKGPDSRVMRAADRKINYGWRILWRLASEGDEEAMQQINMLQSEMFEYAEIRVSYFLKKGKKSLGFICFGVFAFLDIIVASGMGAPTLGLIVAGIGTLTVALSYFLIFQPVVRTYFKKKIMKKYS